MYGEFKNEKKKYTSKMGENMRQESCHKIYATLKK